MVKVESLQQRLKQSLVMDPRLVQSSEVSRKSIQSDLMVVLLEATEIYQTDNKILNINPRLLALLLRRVVLIRLIALGRNKSHI